MAEKNLKAKDKKPGFFQKLGQKFKNLKSEFKKVTWASKKSTFKNFGIVLGGIIVLAIAIGLVDYCLTSLFDGLATLVNQVRKSI